MNEKIMAETWAWKYKLKLFVSYVGPVPTLCAIAARDEDWITPDTMAGVIWPLFPLLGTDRDTDFHNRTGVFSRFNKKISSNRVTFRFPAKEYLTHLIEWIAENTEDEWNLHVLGEDVEYRNGARQPFIHHTFCFKEVVDAVHFKLRWS